MTSQTNPTRTEASPSERAFLAELDAKALRRLTADAIHRHSDEMFWLLNDEIICRRDAR